MATKATNKVHNLDAAKAAAGAEAVVQAKAKGLVWVKGWGYKGLATKPIQVKHGLNYSQCYLAICAAGMPKAELVNPAGMTDAQLQAWAKQAVAAGESWGYMMARSGLTEGACRTAWEQATGLSSVGKRNGRGGRMAQGGTGKALKHLYTGGQNKALGSEVPKGTPLASAKATKVHKVLKAAPAPIGKARK